MLFHVHKSNEVVAPNAIPGFLCLEEMEDFEKGEK